MDKRTKHNIFCGFQKKTFLGIEKRLDFALSFSR